MATVFFREVFGNDLAPRVVSGIIAFSIFGNIVVMTFTASRGMLQPSLYQGHSSMSANPPALHTVKQEIAKEGVLPFSLFFASSSTVSHQLPKKDREPRLKHRADALCIY